MNAPRGRAALLLFFTPILGPAMVWYGFVKAATGDPGWGWGLGQALLGILLIVCFCVFIRRMFQPSVLRSKQGTSTRKAADTRPPSPTSSATTHRTGASAPKANGRTYTPVDPTNLTEVSELYEKLFAKSNIDKPGSRRGGDVEGEVTLTLEEIALGCQKVLLRSSMEGCSTCGGNGALPGNSASSCTDCKGSGKIQKNQRIAVNVPAGIDERSKIRVTGMGEASPNGGPAGDIYIRLKIKPHPFFKRQGDDIVYELPVSATQVACGGEVEIPTVDGKTTTLTLPANLKNGHSFRLEGLGMPVLNSSSRGHMYVIAKVEAPDTLTTETTE